VDGCIQGTAKLFRGFEGAENHSYLNSGYFNNTKNGTLGVIFGLI